jgi:hypothetical protein
MWILSANSFREVAGMDQKDLKIIEAMMTRVVGVFAEDVQHKFDLLVEGQQMLGDKVDRLEGRMDSMDLRLERVELKGIVLEQKVDGIAAELTAHR